jgi:HEAT repeat protein
MAIIKKKETHVIQQDERRRPRDLGGLLDQLVDSNPVARRWAARDLAAFPAAAEPLARRLKSETDASVRDAILTSLTSIGNSEAVAGLVACLRSEDATLRNEAIDVMKQLPDAVAPIMSDLLKDSDPDVRIFAVNVLESLCHPDVEKWLIEVITTDEHVNVCAAAVDLLGEVGTESAVSPLEALKERFSEEPYITFAVDLALRRIRED